MVLMRVEPVHQFDVSVVIQLQELMKWLPVNGELKSLGHPGERVIQPTGGVLLVLKLIWML